jgi:hypothetical protein
MASNGERIAAQDASKLARARYQRGTVMMTAGKKPVNQGTFPLSRSEFPADQRRADKLIFRAGQNF